MKSTSPVEIAGPSRSHLPALDGVRGLAILLVLVAHLMLFNNHTGSRFGDSLSALRGLGWVGVDLFFVLSGFLITGILYDTLHDPALLSQFLHAAFFAHFSPLLRIFIFPAHPWALVAFCLGRTAIRTACLPAEHWRLVPGDGFSSGGVGGSGPFLVPGGGRAVLSVLADAGVPCARPPPADRARSLAFGHRSAVADWAISARHVTPVDFHADTLSHGHAAAWRLPGVGNARR